MTAATPSSICLVVASNSDRVLQSNLMRSPDVAAIAEVSIQSGAESATRAYNAGLRDTSAPFIVFSHQDVFLPEGWLPRLVGAIEELARQGHQWGVLGVYGVDADGHGKGHLYSAGLRGYVGAPVFEPAAVQTLDEVILVLRRDSGLSFDENLPGFHLYGTDICLTASARGLGTFVFDGFCVHNSNGIVLLPVDYWKSWQYLRKKWRSELPVHTPCMPITRSLLPVVRYLGGSALRAVRGGRSVGTRVDDPVALFDGLEGPRTLTAKTGRGG